MNSQQIHIPFQLHLHQLMEIQDDFYPENT